MRGERGFFLPIVLATFFLISIIGLGALSLVMNDLHGAVAAELAVQAMHTAEAGLNFGVSQLVARAAVDGGADEAYAGETEETVLSRSEEITQGTFQVIVQCTYPYQAAPPGCRDDPGTADDERDFRRVISMGFVPGRPGRARRQVEAIVRRYRGAQGDKGVFGVCGREGVELTETVLIADVGSNGDVRIDGSPREFSLRQRLPRPPSSAPAVDIPPTARSGGPSGTYTWRITFVDDRGDESGGGPPTSPILLTGEHARLLNISPGDGRTVARRVYRTLRDAPGGPWFLAGTIPDNTTREYADSVPDSSLREPVPGRIEGRATVSGAALCSAGCQNLAEGGVHIGVREAVCPNFLAPIVRPGSQAPPDSDLIQNTPVQTMNWSALHVPARQMFTIQTLSEQNAELHIHLTDITLEEGATLAITGTATVYFHVSGGFSLARGAVFGGVDDSGNLVKPADRIQVMIHAQDRGIAEGGAVSVRMEGGNRVSATIFAPNANILMEDGLAFRGALFGRTVRIVRSGGIFLDPIEGLGSVKSIVRRSPFQYLVRWYDNPSPNGNGQQDGLGSTVSGRR